MKRLFIAFAALVMVTACTPKNHYLIEGSVSNTDAEGALIYLVSQAGPIDSTLITNGAFSFDSIADEAGICWLVGRNMAGTWQCQTLVVVEPGKIHADLDRDSVYGTPLNDSLNACMLRHDFKATDQKAHQMYEEVGAADPVSQPSLYQEFEKYYSEVYEPCLEATMQDLLECNKENVLGLFAAQNLISYDMLPLQQLEQLTADSTSFFAKDSALMASLVRLRQVEATSVGKPFADFECILPSGEMGHLSDLIKGKLALVDFWASWCSPCRQEISANLIRLSKQYAKQGLLVVGVDVWDTPERHADAVKQLGIPYPQVIDTTKKATDLYGIQSIPQIMLISADGTILARNLREYAIEEAILEAIK